MLASLCQSKEEKGRKQDWEQAKGQVPSCPDGRGGALEILCKTRELLGDFEQRSDMTVFLAQDS